ncbi:hypothetical protein T440DRAFT_466128 [Plenodomus tracheiphilus IPT5]|uniref:DnaJ homologue subfamily C member 28 conserved domain-containing protein n=1 Tax=Plenodomus tracheiphilus IPT5 TaxID=1408161 RepID=A0A6A7BF73_9PLEO|nr:hypothetical protein T440DRAFT_466128 [Plenodomus tracheiphilus IPT5]
MPVPAVPRPYICAGCLRAKRPSSLANIATGHHLRQYATAAPQRSKNDETRDEDGPADKVRPQEVKPEPKEEGALTRRLRNMSEEALESGGHGALKAVQESGGFSAELKAQLEQRIAGASLRSSEAGLPAAASHHTRDLATAEAWTGTESIHDASLRMLNDAHKPLRLGRPPKMPGVQPPRAVDTGHKRSKEGRGLRLANARDRSTVYANVKDDAELDAMERETRFQQLKDRFDPHARTIVPGTISGIASLASKRIEDAIARGQFKNITRGKGINVERDHNASSPFIDTTEYFLNKMIQKQEIVPPWIEKQQELASAANKFRTRLRHDWKRHAARMISSKGGSLEEQVRRAEAYAKAELISNPLNKKQEILSSVDGQGHLSQISSSSEVKTTTPTDDLSSATAIVAEEITAKRITLESPSNPPPTSQPPPNAPIGDSATQSISIPLPTAPPPTVPPAPFPFRDPDWERIETPYFTLAIADLNSKARSYNLQAPDLAKKPYFNLQRELNSCYADIAPQLPGAILDRARAPPRKVDPRHSSTGEGVLGSIMGGPVRVRDERREKQYGFRQFWKDLWG